MGSPGQRSALGPSLLLLQLGNNLPATGLEEEWNQWGSALEGVQMSQSGSEFTGRDSGLLR